MFSRPGVVELLNLQEESGKAKRYQVRQVRDTIRRNRLEGLIS